MPVQNLYYQCTVVKTLIRGILMFGLAITTWTSSATVATNFVVIDHFSGEPIALTNFQGSVILLDFCAYWCSPCQLAAADVEPNITEYFENSGGNSNGVPVQVINITLSGDSGPGEDLFIQTYGLELVADDLSGAAARQFNQGVIPQFAVINGTTNSINCAPWLVLCNPDGYATNSTVPYLKSYMDAVDTPPPAVAVVYPFGGASLSGSNVVLKANVVSNGKIIRRVEFYDGPVLLGTATNAPYSITWINAGAGLKAVYARACYGASSGTNSVPVNFTVGMPILASLHEYGTNLMLSWSGGTGYYQVQFATSLFSPLWNDYGPAGSSTNIVIVPTNFPSFFRVQRQ